MARLVTRRLLTVLLAGAFAALASTAGADANWKETGNSKATKLEQCVRPTPEIRRNHMALLKHQRDVTVHQGVRKTTDALAGCIDCHVNSDAQGKPVPVPPRLCETADDERRAKEAQARRARRLSDR